MAIDNVTDNKNITIDFEDLIKLCNGHDENGACSSAAIVAQQYQDKKWIAIEKSSVAFGAAEINIEILGDRIIVHADFPPISAYEGQHAKQILTDWMTEQKESSKNSNEESTLKTLSLVVVPLAFMGAMYIVFNQLTGFYASVNEDKQLRLTMSFDRNFTQIEETDEIDLVDIEETVRRDLVAEEKALDEEMFALRNQIKEEQERDDFDEEMSRRFSSIDAIVDANAQEADDLYNRPGIRLNHGNDNDD